MKLQTIADVNNQEKDKFVLNFLLTNFTMIMKEGERNKNERRRRRRRKPKNGLRNSACPWNVLRKQFKFN